MIGDKVSSEIWRYRKSNSEPSLVNNENNTILAWKLFPIEDTDQWFKAYFSFHKYPHMSTKWTQVNSFEKFSMKNTTEVNNKKNTIFSLSVHLASNHLIV